MLISIKYFAYLLGVNPLWIILILALLLILGIVKCIYPWQPKWKSKKTKDKDGNEIIIHYHLDE